MRIVFAAMVLVVMVGCASQATPLPVEAVSRHRVVPTVTVAVLDTGARLSRPELRDKVVAVVNVSGVGEADDVTDRTGHGTALAGLVAKTNPDAGLVIVKVSDDGTGEWENLKAGLDWVARDGSTYNVTCCVLAFGGAALKEPYESPVRDSITVLRVMHIPVVVSAGNKGQEGMGAPAIFPESFSVGACDQRVTVAPYSNRLLDGPYRTDVFVYGWAMCADNDADNGFVAYQGSSVSAAVAAGIVSKIQLKVLRWRRGLPSVDALEAAARWRRNPSCPVFDYRTAKRYLRRVSW